MEALPPRGAPEALGRHVWAALAMWGDVEACLWLLLMGRVAASTAVGVVRLHCSDAPRVPPFPPRKPLRGGTQFPATTVAAAAVRG